MIATPGTGTATDGQGWKGLGAGYVEAVIGFVLSGGANLGSIHVGMVTALLEADIKPDVIVGTSIGAVNAAYLAADPTLEQAEERIVQLPSIKTQVSLWDMSRHGELIDAAYEATREFLAQQQGDEPADGHRIEVATVPEIEVETQVPEEDGVPKPQTRSAGPSDEGGPRPEERRRAAAMAAAVGLCSRSSRGTGRAIDQLGRSSTVPGTLGRSSTTAASSRVAVRIIDGARARRRWVATTTSAGEASSGEPVQSASRSRIARAAASLGSRPRAWHSARSASVHIPATVGRSWVVTAARAWTGKSGGRCGSNHSSR
jgi:hypothetical protein